MNDVSSPPRVQAQVFLITPEGAESNCVLSEWPAVIGTGKGSVIHLSGWKAGKKHASLINQDGELWIEDAGTYSGTWINGSRVVRHGPLSFGDEITMAGYRLRVDVVAPQAARPPRPAQSAAPRPVRPAELAEVVEVGTRSSPSDLPRAGTASAAARPVQDAAVPAAPSTALAVVPGDAGEMFKWRKRVHELLLETIDLRRADLIRMTDAELKLKTTSLIREIVDNRRGEIPRELDTDRLIQEVVNEAVGLGPLEGLLGDPDITEIMVNRSDEIFIERKGRLTRHPMSFTSDRAVLGVIERIVTPIGRRIDESSPMVDARLKDGSRVNAIIPPLALKGPSLTIRKFSARKLQPQDMVAYGSVSPEMVEFLRICVVHRKNVIVSGGTGTGKTTFLNVLSNFIPDGERIVTVEDAAELRLNHSHLVSLEARPANAEGRGGISIRDLVKNCLRMRPDRIVVGECRSGEALDMLQAMNTGHEGSLTTAHANTPRDALARLETMVLMAGMELPLSAIREQIASAIDIIVQLTRFPCGSRKITSITEVTGMENNRLQLLELFRFDKRGRDAQGKVMGAFVSCDAMPTFYEDLRAEGVELDLSIFKQGD